MTSALLIKRLLYHARRILGLHAVEPGSELEAGIKVIVEDMCPIVEARKEGERKRLI